MIPISELLTANTTAQVRATMVALLISLGIRADLWKQGGTFSTMLTVGAATYAGFSQMIVAALSAGFLPTATGAWLVLLAYYVYGVTATPATFASGSLTLTNTGGGVYPYLAGKAVFGNANKSGVQYTNVNPFTLGAATLAGPTSLTIAIVCTSLGSAGNANPGDISVLVTTMQNVTCSNANAVAGQDAMPDATVRTLCLAKLASLSVRSPRNAYLWAIQTAINATTNAPVNINRVQVLSPGATYVNGTRLAVPDAGSPGTVTIYCASPTGAPSAEDMTASGLSVEANVRPQAVNASLLSATAVTYTRTLNVYATPAAGTVAQVAPRATTAVTNFFSTYKLGGQLTDNPNTPQGLYGTALAAAIGQAFPAGSIVLVEDAANPGNPPPDLALANGQVATNAVTIAVRAVASS